MDEINYSPDEKLFKAMQEVPSERDSISPDEKLFKAIQGLKPERNKFFPLWLNKLTAFLAHKKTKEAKPVPFANVFKIKNIGGIFRRAFSGEANLALLNKCLVFVLIILAVFLIRSLIAFQPDVSRVIVPAYQGYYKTARGKEITALSPQEYYLGKIRERNILQPYQEQIAVQPFQQSAPVETINDKVKNLVVLGRIWQGTGNGNEAIIKDSGTGETLFLKEGDVIGKTEVVLEEVLKDKIIVSYNEEQLEF